MQEPYLSYLSTQNLRGKDERARSSTRSYKLTKSVVKIICIMAWHGMACTMVRRIYLPRINDEER